MELIKRNGRHGLLLVRCDRCLGLIGKRLYDLWYNDIYKFEESLDFFRLIFIKRIGNNMRSILALYITLMPVILAGVLNMIFCKSSLLEAA